MRFAVENSELGMWMCAVLYNIHECIELMVQPQFRFWENVKMEHDITFHV